jgi:hypothetical protein
MYGVRYIFRKVGEERGYQDGGHGVVVAVMTLYPEDCVIETIVCFIVRI